MPGFRKKINLDPSMVSGMDNDQKKECMSEIERIRAAAWKYALVCCLGIMIYIFVYDLLSAMYAIKVQKAVGQLSAVLYIIPVFVAVPSFFAHSMNGKWIVAAVIAYMLSAFGAIVTSSLINIVPAPFLVIGAIMYFRLSLCCDMYNRLSKEEGFPEFTSLEHGAAMAREIIERNAKKEEDGLSPLTKAAIGANKKDAEKKESPESDNASEA